MEDLGRFGPKAAEAVPALIEALADEHRWLRIASAEALGKIGPAAAVAIPALTGEPSPAAQLAARKNGDRPIC